MPPSHAHGLGAPGWFGKIATRGDFLQRRWPVALVRACDAWLSGAMRSGPARLGEHWWPTYLNAPLLRFAWTPGVVDDAWWFGVLMPSCDDVGRYFPLVVGAPCRHAPSSPSAWQRLDAWQAHLADAATATLAGASLDTFEAALHQAPPWPAVDSADGTRPAAAGNPWEMPGQASAWWRRALGPRGHAGAQVQWEAGWPEGERFAELLARVPDEPATADGPG